ncbi:hypothetical protein GCM10010519_74160 [Streptomyces lactacystinicus]
MPADHVGPGASGPGALGQVLGSGTRPRVRADQRISGSAEPPGAPDQETRFSCQALLLRLGFDQATQLLV